MDEVKTTQELTLNGQPITQEQLQEKQQNKSVKIIEESPGKFKELQKLNG